MPASAPQRAHRDLNGPARVCRGRLSGGPLIVAALACLCASCRPQHHAGRPLTDPPPADGSTRIAVAPGLTATVPASVATGVPYLEADLDAVITPAYYGGAVQWDPHEWFDLDPARWQRLLKRVEFMRLGYIRCMLLSYWYCLGYDNAGPQFLWDCLDPQGQPLAAADGQPVDPQGRPIGENLRRMQKLYDVLEFCQAHEIHVLLGEWGSPAAAGWIYGPAEHLKPLGIAADDPRYARIVGGLLRYLVLERGYTCIREFNLGNEVNLATAYDPTWTVERWQTSIRNLHAEFVRLGLADRVRLVGPDAGYWNDLWFNETLTGLATEVHTYDVHWYVQDRQVRSRALEHEARLLRNAAALQHPGRPVIYGEIGLSDGVQGDRQWQVGEFDYGVSMASALIQSMRAGFAAAVAWNLDDSIHLNGPLPDSYQYRLTPDIVTKVWGFWNSLGTDAGRPQDEAIRPWFYPWSLLSRTFPRGAMILRTSGPANSGLCAVAARIPAGAGLWHLSFALANDGPTPESCVLAIPDTPTLPLLTGYVYSENLRPTDPDGFPLPAATLTEADLAGGLPLNLPGRSLLLYTTLEGGSAVPLPTGPRAHRADTLDSLAQVCSHSANLGFNGFATHPNRRTETAPDLHPEWFLGDRQRFHRATTDEAAFLTWRLPGLGGYRLGFYHRGSPEGRLCLLVSPDQTAWQQLEPERLYTEPTAEGWAFSLLEGYQGIPPGSEYLRVEILPVGAFDETQLTYVELAPGTLPSLQVTDIEPVRVRQTIGFAPDLPTTVLLRLNHVLPRRLPVRWQSQTCTWDEEGPVTLPGQVAGSALTARATVHRVASLKDPLDSLDETATHSANLGIDRAHAAELGDPSRAMRTSAETAELVYRFAGLQSFALGLSLYSPDDVRGFVAVQTSPDGSTWQDAPYRALTAPGGSAPEWHRHHLTSAAPLPSRTAYLRVQLLAHPCTWIQQLGEVTLSAR